MYNICSFAQTTGLRFCRIAKIEQGGQARLWSGPIRAAGARARGSWAELPRSLRTPRKNSLNARARNGATAMRPFSSFSSRKQCADADRHLAGATLSRANCDAGYVAHRTPCANRDQAIWYVSDAYLNLRMRSSEEENHSAAQKNPDLIILSGGSPSREIIGSRALTEKPCLLRADVPFLLKAYQRLSPDPSQERQ